VWIGFDQPRTLGRWAFGGNTALPVWVNYMGAMLADKEQRNFPQPDGIVSVRIDPETGLLAQPAQDNAIFEMFKQEQIPAAAENAEQGSDEEINEGDDEDSPELLF
jgi:penicillin-binding protein 1A